MAQSMLCHRQGISSIWSYPTSPASRGVSNAHATPASRNRLCTALALVLSSSGRAVHFEVARGTYVTASSTCRAGLGGRPAAALRKYVLSALRSHTGVNQAL